MLLYAYIFPLTNCENLIRLFFPYVYKGYLSIRKTALLLKNYYSLYFPQLLMITIDIHIFNAVD